MGVSRLAAITSPFATHVPALDAICAADFCCRGSSILMFTIRKIRILGALGGDARGLPDVGGRTFRRTSSKFNENAREIEKIGRLFPWARDYLAVYERFHLTGEHTVLAHSVHPSPFEVERLAASGGWVAHCPSSTCRLG
jgi:hypothetical protein